MVPAAIATFWRTSFWPISRHGPAAAARSGRRLPRSGLVDGAVSSCSISNTSLRLIGASSREADTGIEQGEEQVGDQHAHERQHTEKQDEGSGEVHVLADQGAEDQRSGGRQ